MFVPSLSCDHNSMIFPSFTPNFLDNVTIPSSNNDNEDENPPFPAHFPPSEPIQPLPQWDHTTY